MSLSSTQKIEVQYSKPMEYLDENLNIRPEYSDMLMKYQVDELILCYRNPKTSWEQKWEDDECYKMMKVNQGLSWRETPLPKFFTDRIDRLNKKKWVQEKKSKGEWVDKKQVKKRLIKTAKDKNV